jgi:signal transduction histidine kinase
MGRVPGEQGIDTLVRFARLASEAGTAGTSLLPLLADALMTHSGADAVAIVEITENGVRLVPCQHLPEEIEGTVVDPDSIGEELEQRLLAACKGRFAQVRSRPLVSGGGLFGSVIMFFEQGHELARAQIADGLVDLAAVALESDAKMKQLLRSQAELRASQDALARAEKLRALGQMAAGVSHDLKNILNPLSLHLQLITRAADRSDIAEIKSSAAEMKQVLTRGVQTIERLREYSRQSPESRTEEVDLDRLVHEAAEIARPRMASGSGRLGRIVEELGAPGKIMGRSGEIVSALVNLIVNAIDAMRDGGTVTLRTGESGAMAWVQVADDGPGMPPEIEARVFEPFFTTKGQEGTGLGLAMVYACVQRHGGTVKLETAVGKGTKFTLSFPRQLGPA